MVYHKKEYETFLSDLRDAGCGFIWLKPNRRQDNKELQESLIQRVRIDTLKRYFKGLAGGPERMFSKLLQGISLLKGLRLVQKIEECQDKKSVAGIGQADTRKRDCLYGDLGEFTYSNINKLQRAGYHITFYLPDI